jgi:phenylpyruvate tautomerase PptA (4-oxalocrotonate tautomerase family)
VPEAAAARRVVGVVPDEVDEAREVAAARGGVSELVQMKTPEKDKQLLIAEVTPAICAETAGENWPVISVRLSFESQRRALARQ